MYNKVFHWRKLKLSFKNDNQMISYENMFPQKDFDDK